MGVAKAALESTSRYLARHLGPKNIRVNLKDFISDWLKHCEMSTSNQWIDEIHEYRISNPQQEEQDEGLIWGPNDALLQISKLCKESEGFIVDVGQHQMWAAQSLELNDKHRFITSGGLGAMGFALPSAIGACFAKKGNWIVIAGDGCTQLSIAEIQTIKEHNQCIGNWNRIWSISTAVGYIFNNLCCE
jgi:acetolactate synthase-1/2/3 large subunit